MGSGCQLLNDIKNSKETAEKFRDYMELLDLVLVYLGSKCPETYSMQEPGAIHKTRWMAKLLNSGKMVMLDQSIRELPKGYIYVPLSKAVLLFLRCMYIYNGGTTVPSVQQPQSMIS